MDGHMRNTLPIRIPPGTMADTSPGTVFLLAAMWTNSRTFSTLDPSILCQTKFQNKVLIRFFMLKMVSSRAHAKGIQTDFNYVS